MYVGKMRFLSASIVLLTTTGVAMGQSQPEPPDPALVAKGLQLFNDASVSGSGTFSCASCHFSTGHTNNKTYVGLDVVADGDPDGRSTPTLWGAGSRSVYGWGGAAPTLEDSIRGIIVNRMKGKEPTKEALAALSAYVDRCQFRRTGSCWTMARRFRRQRQRSSAASISS